MSDAPIAIDATDPTGAAYDAARRRAIVVTRDDRAQLRAHGRDPVRMLQGLITNDLEKAPAERAVYAAMLTPKGRMVADMRLVRQADGSVLLDLDRAAVDDVLAHTKKYVPPMFARFEQVDPPLRVLGVYGPEAFDIVRAATSIELAGDGDPTRVDDDIVFRGRDDQFAITSRQAGVPGVDVFVPAETTSALHDALVDAGAAPADAATFELLRIEAGWPRWGAELDPDRIPLEAGLLERAISTTKGCYTGQEVIVRILHRGHVNWQLRGLLFGEADPPPAGAELVAETGGKTVARVTSAARSPALGQTVALAYVRREIETGATLHTGDNAAPRPIGGTTATVVDLPFRLASSTDAPA